jgi:N-acyl-D-amino-acid deacylase
LLDLLIRNGTVIDGTGHARFRGDVGIKGDRLVAIGGLRGELARRTIDADGLVVAPGFVDMHTHSDLQILASPSHEAKVCQGITLEVLGQDGLSYAPNTPDVLEQLRYQLAGWNGDPQAFNWDWSTVGEYLGRLDRGIAVNACYLVPHGTLRMLVMGLDDRSPSSGELESMKELLAAGLEEGAVGLSSGLTYTPGMYASTDELVALCEVVAHYGGFYCTHHRNYGARALEAYAECLEIAGRAGCPLHLAHAHLGFPVNRGRAPELLALIDQARAGGTDVTLDSYPYLAAATYLHAYLPGWVSAGGAGATLERLSDLALRERLRAELEVTGSDGHHGVPIDWSMHVISGTRRPEHRRLAGKRVDEAAAEEGQRTIDFVCDLLVSDGLGVSCISNIGNEENVRAIVKHPMQMPGSDGILVGERPHPRGYGTFPRYLAVYVRQLGILEWEEAIRKMTALPCLRLGLRDRGVLLPGMAADVVCVDPDAVNDTATYEEPRQLPEGIPYVLVNGQLVVDDNVRTDVLPGRALRRRDLTIKAGLK